MSDDNWGSKRIFTTGEAAKVCKVSQQTIIRCFDNGRLTGFKVPGSKFRRIPRDELIRFMRANSIPTDILEDDSKRVLVVDDDPRICDLIKDAFAGDTRITIRSASNGYDAGMFTESFRPHLILLDYLLPDINGSHVCQRIKSSEELADTKIVFISGAVKQEEVDALLRSGGDLFVRKPFDLHELHETVCKMLGVAEKHTNGKAQRIRPPAG